MEVQRGRGKQKENLADLFKASNPQETRDELIRKCEKWFESLPSMPNGEVLSRQGAIKAVKSVADHYAKEMTRYKKSPKSSKISTQLNELAKAAEQATKCLNEADNHFQQLDKLLEKLGEDATRRIENLPSHMLRILNESQTPAWGFMRHPYKNALEMYGDRELLDLDRHFLRSEFLRFLALKKRGMYSVIQNKEKISRIESLAVVCRSAASLKGVANSSGGPKRAFQEFRLFPSYQLIEGCEAILNAARLPCGTARAGLLQELATTIRQAEDGDSAQGVTRAIESLPAKVKDQIDRKDTRVEYWALGLLIGELKSLPQLHPKEQHRLENMVKKRDALHVILSRKAVPKRVLDRGSETFRCYFQPWIDIDEASPFT